MSHDLAKMAAERVVVIRDTDSARQAIRAAMDFMVEQGADPTVLLEELAGAALNRLSGSTVIPRAALPRRRRLHPPAYPCLALRRVRRPQVDERGRNFTAQEVGTRS